MADHAAWLGVSGSTLVAGGPALEVAPALLGAMLRHERHGRVAVRLTEVEAYAGADDAGSHAYRGRTARNAVMFGPAGRLYVYFTYGMHHCATWSCGDAGSAAAVLLRAGEVVAGHDLARSRRAASGRRSLPIATVDLARRDCAGRRRSAGPLGGTADRARTTAHRSSAGRAGRARESRRASVAVSRCCPGRTAATGRALDRPARRPARGSRPPVAVLAPREATVSTYRPAKGLDGRTTPASVEDCDI